MLSNEELNFVYKVARDIIEIKEFLISSNRNMSSVFQTRLLSFPTADNGGSDDPCCNTLDIDYLNGTCGQPQDPPCPDGYNKCSGGSDGTWCMPDDGTPCYSYICQQAVCKQVSYSTYLFANLEACQAYCQTTTPDPTLPPPNIFYYKCESGSCIDCSQDPSSCTDKDCDSANYYCSPIKDRAESNCERECDSPPPLKWVFDSCNGTQVVCTQTSETGFDTESECESNQSNINSCNPNCGQCIYSYSFELNEWQQSNGFCDEGCVCPEASGCNGEATCTTCSLPCSQYQGFISSYKDDKIEW